MMWIFMAGLIIAGLLHVAAAMIHPKPDASIEQNPQRRLPTGMGIVMAMSFGLMGVAVGLAIKESPSGRQTPLFDAHTVLPDGRAVISCSPEDLQVAHHNSTIDQFNRLLGGKWVKIYGKIEENYGNGLVFLTTQEYPMIVLQFGKGWDEQLSILPRGSSVTIRGKMGIASLAAIHLEECELL
jgi:hypothetical protein